MSETTARAGRVSSDPVLSLEKLAQSEHKASTKRAQIPKARRGLARRYSRAPMECVLIGCDGSRIDIEAVPIPTSWNGAPAIEVLLPSANGNVQRKQFRHGTSAWSWPRNLAFASDCGTGTWLRTRWFGQTRRIVSSVSRGTTFPAGSKMLSADFTWKTGRG